MQDSVDNIKKQNLITDDELRQQLKKDNIDYNEFINGIKRSIIRNKVIARAVMQEVNLDDKSLKAYYDAHISDYVQEEYRLQQIFVSSQRKDAAGGRSRRCTPLEQGKPFEEAAREFSDDASNVWEGTWALCGKTSLSPS